MHRLRDYTMVVRPDDNGTFVAYLPAIPGCHALGKTPEEAQTELQGVFEMIAEERGARRRLSFIEFMRRSPLVGIDLLHESPADDYRGSLKGVRVSKIREKKDRI
jgi:predicted RNase H-like HicB family nuclease